MIDFTPQTTLGPDALRDTLRGLWTVCVLVCQCVHYAKLDYRPSSASVTHCSALHLFTHLCGEYGNRLMPSGFLSVLLSASLAVSVWWGVNTQNQLLVFPHRFKGLFWLLGRFTAWLVGPSSLLSRERGNISNASDSASPKTRGEPKHRECSNNRALGLWSQPEVLIC